MERKVIIKEGCLTGTYISKPTPLLNDRKGVNFHLLWMYRLPFRVVNKQLFIVEDSHPLIFQSHFLPFLSSGIELAMNGKFNIIFFWIVLGV